MQNITEARLVKLFRRMNAHFEASVNLDFNAATRARHARLATKASDEIAQYWH